MAGSKPISYSQIAEPKLLDPLKKELEEVNNLLKITGDNLKGVISEAATISKATPLSSFDNLEKVEKGLKDAKTAIEQLDKVEKDRLKLEEQIKNLDDERVKTNFALREQIRLQTKELRDEAKAAAASGDAYEVLKKNTNDAQKEFKKLAAQYGVNSKQAKEARKNFEDFDEQLREVNEAARDGRRDVGRYEKGVKRLTKTFKAFASATIVLKILELLQTQLSKNSDGAAELEKVWVRVTTVFQVLVERLVVAFPIMQAKFEQFILSLQIGFAELKGLFGGNEDDIKRLQKEYNDLEQVAGGDLAAAFKGMSAEIEDLISKQVQLIDDTLKYRREIVGLEKDIADIIPTQEKLRAQFEDDSKSLEEQIVAGVAFRGELVKRQDLEETIAVKRLKLAQQNAAANKNSVEAQEELSAATLTYNQLVADQATELVSAEKEIRKLRNDATQLNLDYYIDDFDNRKTVNERIIADETQTYTRRKSLLEDNLRNTEASFALEEKALRESVERRGKTLMDLTELSQLSTEEIADYALANFDEPLAIRLLEVLRERRTFLQDNAEAQRDLNAAEAESLLLQDDVALQKRALLKLEQKGIDMEKVLKTLSDARLQNEIDNLRKQIAVAEDGSAAFIRLNQELNDKLLEQNEQRNEKQRKQLEEFGKAADTAFQLLSDIASKRSEERLEAIDEEIEAEEKRLNRLRELADQGNEDAQNNIAVAQQRQAQLELERERQLARQKKSELALTAIQTYSGKVTSGTPNPLASTISDIAVLRAFVNTLPGFFEGTEDTGTEGALRDKHGAITGFTHERERVLNADQNRLIGDMSNSELAMLAHRENTKQDRSLSSDQIIKELQDLKRTTKERPVYLGADIDEVNGHLIKKIKTGQKLERIHTKTGGIWGK